MRKKRWLSLAMAGALTLSLTQAFPVDVKASLVPTRKASAYAVLNDISDSDMSSVKLSQLIERSKVTSYQDSDGKWESDEELSMADFLAGEGIEDYSAAWLVDPYTNEYEVYEGKDAVIDLSDYTDSTSSKLTMIIGSAKQLDSETNIEFTFNIKRSGSFLDRYYTKLDLSNYSDNEIQNYPIDNLKNDLVLNDSYYYYDSEKPKDFDISKATKLWVVNSEGTTEYEFGKDITVDILSLVEEDENEIYIGSGNHAIDNSPTDCVNRRYIIRASTFSRPYVKLRGYIDGSECENSERSEYLWTSETESMRISYNNFINKDLRKVKRLR